MTRPPLSFEALTNYFNSRNPREKMLLVSFGICFLLAVDILAILQPLAGSFFKTLPALTTAKTELKGLKDDKKNEKVIEAKAEATRQQFEAAEKRFAVSGELSAEALSEIARETGVKITSLTPTAKPKAGAGGYSQVSVKLSALSGVHSLGKFLAKAESHGLFFRVDNLTIRENTEDMRNHTIEMNVESYRK